ncbi:MAG: hypothetical protein F6J92_19505 [Symploca sp. SIO1A3]|nr:hypothetical protein [Symploca sp. SIO2C1]NER48839.1 hypothetical protein [Symploca sp. SIO1A3]
MNPPLRDFVVLSGNKSRLEVGLLKEVRLLGLVAIAYDLVKSSDFWS